MKQLLVILDDADIALVPTAHRIASATGDTLGLLCATKDIPRLQEVSGPDDDAPPLLRAVVEAAGAGVTVYDGRGGSLYRTVLDAARELDAHRLVLPMREDGVIRHLLRAAPHDVLVLEPAVDDAPPHRIVVPQLGGGGAHAMLIGARCFGDDDRPIVALPDVAARARSKRVFEKTVQRLSDPRATQLTQGSTDQPFEAALAETIEPGDLVLLDASEAKLAARLRAKLVALRDGRSDRDDAGFCIGAARSATAAGPGRLERAVERLRTRAPALTRTERRSLHELLERDGQLSTDFVVMLTLSAAIAALGLIQSSASVVIGAMLVAPLMTPLIAIGMSLAQGNSRLFGGAIRAMGSGILGALLVSVVVGLLSPWDDLSAEVVARGSPNVFDLGVAVLSGMAASFALARPGLAGTLVGVAIAVALLPPLAAVGIASIKGEFGVALGAATLFTTNLLAIVIGSAIVFRLFGVDPSARGVASPPWVRRTLMLVSAGLLATTAVLVMNLNLQTQQGVNRPYARPLPPQLRASIRARVAEDPGTEILLMAESGIEHGFGLEIVLCAPGPIAPDLVPDLEALIERTMGPDRPARILALPLLTTSSDEARTP